MKHKKISFKFLLFWFIASVSFILIGSLLIINASGYKINIQTKTIEKTGLLSLQSKPKEAQVYLNGQLKASNTPVTLNKLLPGWYDVEIRKAEYRSWTRTVSIEGGLTKKFNNTVLFLVNPIIKPANEDEIKLVTNIENPDDLKVNEYTIYRLADNKPITVANLSQLVKSAYWYVDHSHVAYQVDNEIYISEKDGRSAELILKLDSNDPTKIAFSKDGKIMIVSQNDKVYEVTIINPND
jgi:hypothetical protein